LLAKRACGSSSVGPGSIVSVGGEDLLAYGPQLKLSRDFGRTWTTPNLTGSVVGLTVGSGSVWALVTHRCRPRQQTCALTLVRSANGGVSWHPVAHQPPQRTVALSVALGGEAGTSTLVGAAPDGSVLLALPELPRGPVDATPLQATVDRLGPGAHHWTTATVPCAAGLFTSDLTTAPDGSAWLACAGEPSAGAQLKSLALSRNGGTSWKAVSPPCPPSPDCGTMPIGGYLGGVYALSSSTVFYAGGRSPLTGTHDGGRTWRAWQSIGGQDTGSAQVTFYGSRDGWAVAENPYYQSTTLWRTVDGGLKWSKAQ
jgi:hypothetical protein